jgi:hypothetical protein
MSRTVLVAAAACALSAAALLTPAEAASVSGLATSKILPAQTLIEKAGYGRCWRWNAVCRDRWGFGWRYRRCMRLHAC